MVVWCMSGVRTGSDVCQPIITVIILILVACVIVFRTKAPAALTSLALAQQTNIFTPAPEQIGQSAPTARLDVHHTANRTPSFPRE